ncbi:succinyl-CoA ligase subunit beta [Klebsiella grimontii]|nr:succinyl-CoA ligase subunit beta [Klebsiella grimontii]
MNLHEYQAKQLFARYGLPAPVGYACTTPREAEEAASKIGAGPWVVKCQVHAGGRGKAGGVKVVKSKEDIRAFAEHWLGKRLVTYQTDANGQPVNQILVEAATDIDKELYLGAVVDRSSVAWSSWPLPKAAWKSKKWRKRPAPDPQNRHRSAGGSDALPGP